MKRLISAIICLVLIVALVGCGQNNAADNSGDNTTTTNQLEAIKAAGVMKVGIEGTYKPYTYHAENGDLAGFDLIWPVPSRRSWVLRSSLPKPHGIPCWPALTPAVWTPLSIPSVLPKSVSRSTTSLIRTCTSPDRSLSDPITTP